jgi:osmotically-inducible protein OsmY
MLFKIHMVAAAALLAMAASGSQAQTTGIGSDDTISKEVTQRLNQQSDLQADLLHVQTVDGVVYLHGQVDSGLEAQEAEALAHGVPEVHKVVNLLESGAVN